VRRYEQIAGLLLIAAFIWLVAFWVHVRYLPEPATIDHPPATINTRPSTIDARFVASTIDRTAKRYHLPTCSYVKLMQHGREFESEEEARAAGYEPCQRCLSMSRVARLREP